MTELIKLTNANGYTRRGEPGEMLWGDGVANEAPGEGTKLCTNGVIHAYKTPLLAVFMDPVHADYLIRGGLAWLSEGRIVADDGLKIGCKRLTTIRRIQLPEVTTAQHIAFGILSVMKVCQEPKWRSWAEDWLSGKDRSAKAAADAARAAAWAADAAGVARAAWAAADAAAWAAKAAAWAAKAAAHAARAAAKAADATAAAWAAAHAARAAAHAARAAAWAADATAASGKKIDFAAIAEKAMQYE